MRVLVQVLKKIYQDYAIIYPPAEKEEIQLVIGTLIHENAGFLPSDYREFLCLTDGLFWNGIEFFSTREHERDNGAFTHRAILAMQATFYANQNLKGKIILGLAPEEIIAYDSKRREYQLIDRYSYTIFVKFPSLADVLYFYARNVLDK